MIVCVVGRVGIDDDHLMAASALVATMNLRMTPNIIPRIVLSPSSRLLWTMGKCCGILVPSNNKGNKVIIVTIGGTRRVQKI